MKFLEFGDPKKPKLLLIHGFMSPIEIWDPYIKAFQDDYFVIAPILPGHNRKDPEEFVSLEETAKSFLDYYIPKFGTALFAIYGMSMGGVLAAKILESGKLSINKIIMESSPLLPWENFIIKFMTEYYINITYKARARDKKIVKQAVGSMVTEEQLPFFLELLDKISDDTIINYLYAVGKYKLSAESNAAPKIYYLYGGKINEILFKNVAKFITKNYPNANCICLKGKGHCEDALIHPKIHIDRIDEILKD